MPIKLPPLKGLRLFEAAARCGSLKRAALELNLTPGALSHGIDSLEQWLDIELFERKGHGIVLTAAGRQYLPYVSEALAMIAAGTLRLPNRHFDGRLSISATPLFAFRILLPRLHRFQEQHPDIQVKVDASRFVVDLAANQIDLAIRSSPDAIAKMSCDLLGRVSFVPIGAPHYVEKLSCDGKLDWSRATVIHTLSSNEDWETWCNHSRADISRARELTVSSAQVAFQAARDGLGIAIGRLPLIDDDIAAGHVAVAVDHVVPVTSAYWLVKAAGAETRRETAAFRNWLLKEVSQLRWNGQRSNKPDLQPLQALAS